MIPSLLKVISSRLFVTYINQLTWNLYVGCGVEGVVHGHISERGRLVLLDLGKGVAVKCKHNDSGKLKQNNMLSTYDEINQNYVCLVIRN